MASSRPTGHTATPTAIPHTPTARSQSDPSPAPPSIGYPHTKPQQNPCSLTLGSPVGTPTSRCGTTSLSWGQKSSAAGCWCPTSRGRPGRSSAPVVTATVRRLSADISGGSPPGSGSASASNEYASHPGFCGACPERIEGLHLATLL